MLIELKYQWKYCCWCGHVSVVILTSDLKSRTLVKVRLFISRRFRTDSEEKVLSSDSLRPLPETPNVFLGRKSNKCHFFQTLIRQNWSLTKSGQKTYFPKPTRFQSGDHPINMYYLVIKGKTVNTVKNR